jgi:hypothetical protein
MDSNEFVMTLDSDTEDPPVSLKAGRSKPTEGEDAVLNTDFSFDFNGEFDEAFVQDQVDSIVMNGTRPVRPIISPSTIFCSLIDVSRLSPSTISLLGEK